jgi:hypothetical protein
LDIIEVPTPQPKYFLSPNAAKGIIARVIKRGRRMFPPLWKALETLAKAQSFPSCHTASLPQLDGTPEMTGVEHTSSTLRKARSGG